ncbi:disease resistance protein RUN1 [Cryptomeria japonica]|uniref:disease resistance protein RUN1 n=1 Tax=Cryptomeria japonica TaxID=3369 RepID=UPI0027DA27E7|nr:disease resistance protein RUN1 [Cryptomeria japonica]
MGKFSFPSCCCSCSCFSSSSSAQEVSIVVHSTQPSQQPANSGPSTPSSSLHPSQKSANVGPSTATNFDLESYLQKFNDIGRLKDLIQFIEELLKKASGEKEEGSSSAASSYIQDGQTFLELVDKNVGKLSEKHDSMDGASADIEKVVINLLKGAAQIHWVGAALSVVGFVLARYNEMSNNQRECLEILKVLVNLENQILKLNEQMPEEGQRLNEAVKCIVEGCIMCASQLAAGKFVSFLTASVKADGLKGFQAKIDRLYQDLTLSTVRNIQNRIPKISSQSKISYNPAVGIESAQERVTQLLDLNAQHTSAQLVVVYGLGGIGKTTLADAVYDCIDDKTYKKCRIHMDQHCTKRDLKGLQELILKQLFKENVELADCDDGRQMIWRVLNKNPNQPVFLYIDNGLKKTDLKQLLPKELGSCLPPRSRILLTTRNLRETDMFAYWNVERAQYLVNPLQQTEARKILLKRATDHNNENHIHDLLQLCGGVPLLLELAGAQLAISTQNTDIMVLQLLKEGEKVEEEDISDRMIDFVYNSLLPPVKEAFLDITSLLYSGPHKCMPQMESIGEEELRALEEASFIKRYGHYGMTIHDIVEARGKKMAQQEGNRITNPEALLDCLKYEEKRKNLKGIYFREYYGQPPIENNDDHLNCMGNSLRVLSYENGSQITFRGKCHKSFEELRCLQIPYDVSELPMEFEKLEHLGYYDGPFTQAMSLYELPPSLRSMRITVSAENGVKDSKVTSASSLVELDCYLNNIVQSLPDGMEKLTKLERLTVWGCHQLRELPSKFGELRNLRQLTLFNCNELKELPSDFGRLSNLEWLFLEECHKLKQLSSDFGQPSNLKYIFFNRCSTLSESPYSFGQLNNLKYLSLIGCSALSVLPSEFGLLKNLEYLDLSDCSGLKELPCDFGQLQNLKRLDLKGCSGLEELPSDFGQLKNLKWLNLRQCSGLKELPLSLEDLVRGDCIIYFD